MAFEVINFNQTASYVVDNTDTVTLLESRYVSSSTDAFQFDSSANLSNITLNIQGSAIGGSRGVDFNFPLVNGSSLSNSEINVFETGVVFGGQEAIRLRQGDNNTVTNYGTISAGGHGIEIAGGDNIEVANFGSINVTGFSAAVEIGDGSAEIINAGAISGGNALSLIDVSATLRLVNSGDLLANGRTAILTDVQADRVINSGFIDGDINLSGGADFYRGINTGITTGTVFGGDGNDLLIGGDLGDAFDGGLGADTLRGEAGNDLLDGGATGDTVIGGTGDDTLFGGNGNDRLVGGADNDLIHGDNNDDMLYGNAGDDTLFGGNGIDALRGGAGDDSLNGGSDNDVLFGNAGNDTLFGGLGRDVMFGGGGADTFEFTSVSQSPPSGPARDVIRDFETGVDVIDLAALAPGALDFVGTGGFTGGGTGSVRTVITGGGTLLQIDADGDGTRDMDIFLDGVTGLTADDFVL